MIKKIIIYTTIFFVLVFSLIYFQILKYSSSNLNKEVDYMIVLGAKLWGEKPSPVLQRRLEKAIDYLKKYKKTKVIVSGAKGSDEIITEALAMKNYLVKNNIDSKRIFMEDKSFSTKENIKNSLQIIKNKDSSINEVVVVTNGFHVFRSSLLVKRFGFKPFAIASSTPSSIVFYSYIREALAVIKTFIFDW